MSKTATPSEGEEKNDILHEPFVFSYHGSCVARVGLEMQLSNLSVRL